MKTKALALLVLLVLPLAIVPSATFAQTVNPRIWVNPGESKFYAPCQVSNEFTVEIKLWNKKEITGKSIYAFDFKVQWDLTLLSFVKAEVFPPWPEGKYYIIKNVFDEIGGYYQLAITALDNAPPLDDVQLVLAKITFHIETEPCWPDVYTTAIDIFEVKLSDGCGNPVDCDVVDGSYTIYSGEPFMWLNPEEFSFGCICKNQVVSVMVKNLTKAKGFYFVITWNNSELLEANIQCVHVTDLFPPPYTEYFVEVGDDYVAVEVLMPCEKPPISCVEGPVATICFHTKFDPLGQELPTAEDVAISFDIAKIYYCGGWKDVPTEGALYQWRPKVEDLNLDCHVDVVDLGAIAKQYGKQHVWSQLKITGSEPNVDLYDIVVVAKKFCKTN